MKSGPEECGMDRHEKISYLLDITGAPLDKLGLARRNYERLSDQEIDARIVEFEDINAHVRAWRDARKAEREKVRA